MRSNKFIEISNTKLHWSFQYILPLIAEGEKDSNESPQKQDDTPTEGIVAMKGSED